MRWAIQFKTAPNYPFGEIEFMDDQITVFIGMYGVPTYCIWYIAPDRMDNIDVDLIFKVHLYSAPKKVDWEGSFTVQNVIYDVQIKKFRVFGIGYSFHELQGTIDLNAVILSKDKSTPMSAMKFLRMVVETSSPVLVEFSNIKETDELHKYLAASFDTHMSVLDIVTRVCQQNKWEWYLRNDRLFIAPYLFVKSAPIKETDLENKKGKLVRSGLFYHMMTEATACQPGSVYQDNKRVLWVKYYLGGKIGSHMSVMLFHTQDYISEETYIGSLDKDTYQYGVKRLMRNLDQYPIILGKIYGSYSSVDMTKEKYEAAEFAGDIRNYKNDLSEREFNTGFTEDDPARFHNEDVKMTTPFAGNKVGMVFPQGESHHVLFSPNNDREVPLVGPAYYGANETPPRRSVTGDMRLQMQEDNGDIYWDSATQKWFIEGSRVSLRNKSTASDAIPIDYDVDLVNRTGKGSHVSLLDDGNIYIQSEKGGITVLPAGGIEIAGALTSTIKLQIGSSTITINSAGVTIDGCLKVNGQIKGLDVATTSVQSLSGQLPAKIVAGT